MRLRYGTSTRPHRASHRDPSDGDLHVGPRSRHDDGARAHKALNSTAVVFIDQMLHDMGDAANECTMADVASYAALAKRLRANQAELYARFRDWPPSVLRQLFEETLVAQSAARLPVPVPVPPTHHGVLDGTQISGVSETQAKKRGHFADDNAVATAVAPRQSPMWHRMPSATGAALGASSAQDEPHAEDEEELAWP